MQVTWITTLAVMAPLALAAQAPAEAPVDPVGRFQFEVKLPDGTALGGQITIKGQPGAYEGTISSDLAPEAPIGDITVEGRVLRFTVRPPDGTVVPVRLTFAGDEFAGGFDFSGMAIPITGKRVRAP